MTARGVLLLLLSAAALLGGCQSKSRTPSDPFAAPNRPMAAWGETANGLRIGVLAKTRGATGNPPAGGPVVMTVTFQNVGAKPLRIVLPQSLYLSSEEPPEATVAVRVATPSGGGDRPIYFVGPGPEGVRDVLLRPGETVALPGTIDRRAWPEPSDARFAGMRLTARYIHPESTTAPATREAAGNGNAATQPTLWIGTARSGPAPIVID